MEIEVIASLYEYNQESKKMDYYNSILLHVNNNTTITDIFDKITENDNFINDRKYIMLLTEMEHNINDMYFIFTDDDGNISKVINLEEIIQ